MTKKLIIGMIAICSIVIVLVTWKPLLSESTEDRERLQTLRQHEWLLENYYTQNGKITIPQEAKVIFTFDDGDIVHVSGLCNWNVDSYHVEGRSFIYTTAWMSAEAICFSDYFDIMKAEGEIRKSLIETRKYTVSSEKLQLLDSNNNPVAEFIVNATPSATLGAQ